MIGIEVKKIFIWMAISIVIAQIGIANDIYLIDIYTPKENDSENNTIVVRGHISPNLGENDYLWIGVKPLKDIKNWWPQDNDRLRPIKGIFEGNAFLGGSKGDQYEIGIFIVNESLNQKMNEWLNFSKKYNIWPAITEEKKWIPTVTKEELEEHKYANVNVTLDN